MAQPLARDLGMDTIGEHVRGVSVSKIVKPDARKRRIRQLAKPVLRQRIRLQRRAIGLRNNERIVRQDNADTEQLLGLPQSVRAQILNQVSGERQRASLAAASCSGSSTRPVRRFRE